MSWKTRVAFTLLIIAGMVAGGCRQDAPDRLAANGIAPVYNKETGRLEQLLSDRDGDGRQETRAFMDGAQLQRIEIDRFRAGHASPVRRARPHPRTIGRGSCGCRPAWRRLSGHGAVAGQTPAW